MVRAMRHTASGPLALVPAMIMSARAQAGAWSRRRCRAGAHQVLVLPISASTLYRRLDWLINDDRPFELKGEHYVVAGLEERLSLSIQRPVYVPGEPSLAPAPLMSDDELRSDARYPQESAGRAELGAGLDRGRPSAHSPPAKQQAPNTRIMGIFTELFAWWTGNTIGTRLYTWRKGERVGEDGLGNVYYQERGGKRRWVIYKTPRRAVAGPARMAWLAASHRRCAADARGLSRRGRGRRRTAPISPAPTRHIVPPGSTLRPGATKPPLDYEPWQPK